MKIIRNALMFMVMASSMTFFSACGGGGGGSGATETPGGGDGGVTPTAEEVINTTTANVSGEIAKAAATAMVSVLGVTPVADIAAPIKKIGIPPEVPDNVFSQGCLNRLTSAELSAVNCDFIIPPPSIILEGTISFADRAVTIGSDVWLLNGTADAKLQIIFAGDPFSFTLEAFGALTATFGEVTIAFKGFKASGTITLDGAMILNVENAVTTDGRVCVAGADGAYSCGVGITVEPQVCATRACNVNESGQPMYLNEAYEWCQNVGYNLGCDDVQGCCEVPCDMCSRMECADDPIDEDGDGLVGCADPHCAPYPPCVATADETSDCFDDVDNDADGLVDCADPDCATKTFCICGEHFACLQSQDGFPAEWIIAPGGDSLFGGGGLGAVACNDTIVAGLPGVGGECQMYMFSGSDHVYTFWDFELTYVPPGVTSVMYGCCAPVEAQIEFCNNGLDDDGDTFVDCNDPDCVGKEACAP